MKLYFATLNNGDVVPAYGAYKDHAQEKLILRHPEYAVIGIRRIQEYHELSSFLRFTISHNRVVSGQSQPNGMTFGRV